MTTAHIPRERRGGDGTKAPTAQEGPDSADLGIVMVVEAERPPRVTSQLGAVREQSCHAGTEPHYCVALSHPPAGT